MALNISEEKLADIKNAADIIDIISEAVMLKKAGKNHVGLCPFHSEKTPSFTVSSEKQMYYCFGCGAGGDIISFMMEHDGASFGEAVRKLAARYGIEIPVREMSGARKKELSEREKLFAINKLAGEFFHYQLLDTSNGKKALLYLEKRGITKKIIETFNIGYAPSGWENLKHYLTHKKVPEKFSEKAGLIILGKKGGFYDRFRDRVMFPICDAGSRTIGFGGRVLNDSLPKYLNTPETPVYSKSASLYGLHHTKRKCRESGTAFIVEGYMDMLALFKHAFTNVVATLGTALTAEHVNILKGHVRRVILVYDSDEAGLKAAARGVHVLNNDLEPSIMVLPEGFDPDSFLFKFGTEAFMKEVEGAIGVMDFLMDSAVKKHGLSVDGIMRIISEIKVHLARINDKIERSLYVRRLAERIGVDEAAVLEKVRKAAVSQAEGQAPESSMDRKWNRMEERMLAMMIQYPEILPEIKKRSLLDFFEDRLLKTIGQKVMDIQNPNRSGAGDLMALAENQEEQRVIASLSLEDCTWDHDGCIGLINQFASTRTLSHDHLIRQIRDAEQKNDHELLIKLLEEKQRMAKENIIH